MAQQIFKSINDGRISAVNSTWNACHDDTTGVLADYFYNIPIVAMLFSGFFYVYRAFITFNTSSLPPNANITSAKLHFYKYGSFGVGVDAGNNDLVLVQATPSDPENWSGDDYNNFGATNNPTEGASRVTVTSASDTGWDYFDLNATGISWLNAGGYTSFGIRADLDADDTQPSAFDSTALDITGREYVDRAPYLEVNFTAGKQPLPVFYRTTI